MENGLKFDVEAYSKKYNERAKYQQETATYTKSLYGDYRKPNSFLSTDNGVYLKGALIGGVAFLGVFLMSGKKKKPVKK